MLISRRGVFRSGRVRANDDDYEIPRFYFYVRYSSSSVSSEGFIMSDRDFQLANGHGQV